MSASRPQPSLSTTNFLAILLVWSADNRAEEDGEESFRQKRKRIRFLRPFPRWPVVLRAEWDYSTSWAGKTLKDAENAFTKRASPEPTAGGESSNDGGGEIKMIGPQKNERT